MHYLDFRGVPYIRQTNDEMVNDVCYLKEYQTLLQTKKAKARELGLEIRNLEFKIDQLMKITEIFDGVALHIYGLNEWNTHISSVTSLDRQANVCPNAYNNNLFILTTSGGPINSVFYGNRWPSKESAVLAAEKFVAHGITPEHTGHYKIQDAK